jgi:hypothetical protein
MTRHPGRGAPAREALISVPSKALGVRFFATSYSQDWCGGKLDRFRVLEALVDLKVFSRPVNA